RQFDARPGDWILRIGCVISGRTMAVLALNAGKVRSGNLAGESGRQLVPHRVTGQATGILVRMGLLKRCEGAGMPRVHHRVVNSPVALQASLSAGVLWRRAIDPKRSVAQSSGDGRGSDQVGAPTDRLPRCIG